MLQLGKCLHKPNIVSDNFGFLFKQEDFFAVCCIYVEQTHLNIIFFYLSDSLIILKSKND